nr:hypothetical protein [Tanacetum cinerariifolium]
MVIDSSTTLERTYYKWLSRISKPSPRITEFGDWVKLSDPKQELCGRQPMRILVVVMNKCVRSDQVKEGVGYNVVPPLAADLYISPKKDLSWTGLPEFTDDTVIDYSRPLPT